MAPDSCFLPICTVAEVKPRIVEWNGKVIDVTGWLEGCHRTFVCQLKATPAAEYEETLTIDYLKRLEPVLGRLDGKQIVIRAIVTDECAGDNICVDRAPELVPIFAYRVR